MDPFSNFPQIRVEIRQEPGRLPEVIMHAPELHELSMRIFGELGRVFEQSTQAPLSVDRQNIVPVSSSPADKTTADSVENPQNKPENPENTRANPAEGPAKHFTPEKLLNLLLPKFLFQRPIVHPQQQKGEKTQAEEKSIKNEPSRNDAAKGESKFTDGSTGAPEEVDPISKVPQDLFQTNLKESPNKAETQKPDSAEMLHQKLISKEIHPLKGEMLNETHEKHTPKEIASVAKEGIHQAEVSQAKPEAHPSLIGMAIAKISLPSSENTPNQKENSTKIPGAVPVDAVKNEKEDKVRPKGNEGLPVGNVDVDKEARKPAVARKDINYGSEKAEQNPNEQIARNNERIEFRFPIMGDISNPDGTISDEAKRSLEAKMLKGDGHFLGDVALMTLCAVLCGSRTPSEIFHYLQTRKEFFTVWLGLKGELPTLRLITIILSKLNPAALFKLLDMTLYNSAFASLKKIKVWENERGIVLAELLSDVSEDDPVPFADTLETMSLEKAWISVNLPTSDPRVAQLVRRRGGEYIFAVKGAHGAFYDQLREFFEDPKSEIQESLESHQETNAFATHFELKKTDVSGNVELIPNASQWLGLKSAAQIVTETQQGNSQSKERRLYLTSLPPNPELHSQAVRTLASIENRADWFASLDFTRGGEDLSAENFECLRLYSLNLLSKDGADNQAIQSERRKAAKDNSHLRAILSR